jgi:hypothetical protein
MTIFWVGFPAELHERLSTPGNVIGSVEDAGHASISDWLEHQVSSPADQVALKVDLLVVYAHARLTVHAFRQDYEGIELLKHLRVAKTDALGDLRRTHVIILSWESAEEIVKRKAGNVILFSSGVSFLRLPEAIEILSDSDELSRRALDKADLNDREFSARMRR